MQVKDVTSPATLREHATRLADAIQAVFPELLPAVHDELDELSGLLSVELTNDRRVFVHAGDERTAYAEVAFSLDLNDFRFYRRGLICSVHSMVEVLVMLDDERRAAPEPDRR